MAHVDRGRKSCDRDRALSYLLSLPPGLDPTAPCSAAIRAERLGPRLTAVAMAVPEGARVVDVGTDHARLVMALVRSGRCPTGIGVEIADGPYRRARRAVAGAAMSHRIAVRRGSGLDPVEVGEADVAVMAGFGGRTANDVIRAALAAGHTLSRWVVQVNRDVPSVRRTLAASGHRLVEEAMVFDDGRVFVVMAAEPGDEALSTEDVWLGPRLRRARSPLFVAWLAARRAALAGRTRLSSRSSEELAIVEAALS